MLLQMEEFGKKIDAQQYQNTSNILINHMLSSVC